MIGGDLVEPVERAQLSHLQCSCQSKRSDRFFFRAILIWDASIGFIVLGRKREILWLFCWKCQNLNVSSDMFVRTIRRCTAIIRKTYFRINRAYSPECDRSPQLSRVIFRKFLHSYAERSNKKSKTPTRYTVEVSQLSSVGDRLVALMRQFMKAPYTSTQQPPSRARKKLWSFQCHEHVFEWWLDYT